MAIPDWALIVLSFAATLGLCALSALLVGRSQWIASAACVAAGVLTTPVVVFAWFKLAGSIVGSHNSRIWFLVTWLLCIAVSILFAARHRGRAGRGTSRRSRASKAPLSM